MATLVDRGLIGQKMIEANLLVSSQVDELLRHQKESPERIPLGRLSVELRMVTDEEFAPFLASYFDTPYLNLGTHVRVKQEILDLVPKDIARRYNALPLFREGDVLFVAMEDPVDLIKIENLSLITGLKIKPIVSPVSHIRQRIEDCYRVGIFKSAEAGPVKTTQQEYESLPNRDSHSWQVAASFVSLLLERAFRNEVSIIHIQPEDDRLKAFFRVDNRLEKIASYPSAILASISKYIKEASGLNSQRSAIPQTGFFNFRINNRYAEIGVSIHPTLDGERIVLEVPRRLGWFDE